MTVEEARDAVLAMIFDPLPSDTMSLQSIARHAYELGIAAVRAQGPREAGVSRTDDELWEHSRRIGRAVNMMVERIAPDYSGPRFNLTRWLTWLAFAAEHPETIDEAVADDERAAREVVEAASGTPGGGPQ